MIQDAVRRSLVSFTVAQDTELLEQYAVFINIDLDNFVRHSGSLAYIRKQRGNDGQVLIDKQVCGIRSFF